MLLIDVITLIQRHYREDGFLLAQTNSCQVNSINGFMCFNLVRVMGETVFKSIGFSNR